jgi:hypothetical protein
MLPEFYQATDVATQMTSEKGETFLRGRKYVSLP